MYDEPPSQSPFFRKMLLQNMCTIVRLCSFFRWWVRKTFTCYIWV